MPASIQKFPDTRKINRTTERQIECPYCDQTYLLVWDDKEWNSVKGLDRRRGTCGEGESSATRGP